MNSLRRWLYRPKKSDSSLLAQFYFNDEELNAVAAELDSFDGRKDPERCAELVNKLRSCQDCVLTTIQHIMVEAIPDRRTSRDFRVKFPDDVVQENLAGQLWFGAECLAAGSSIMNREEESTSMRPLARALTKNLDSLRCILREQCIRSLSEYSERIKEALVIFDKLFAEFELSYVSAMVPVKTRKEYEMIQEITVLFSETVQRAMKQGHLSQDTIDEYDPALMFTIPRLAIICGLLVYPEGPLNPDNPPAGMSDMFRPFQPLLIKIRELLSTLSCQELYSLEHALCTSEGPPLMTVLESQVSSSDNACQTDFDPSSPTKARLGASLLYPTPLSPSSLQGAECSSLNAAGTPGSECRGKSEMGDLESENEAYSLIGSYKEKESTNGVKIMGAGGEREEEEREKEMREEAKKEEEERATRNEAEEEKELETEDICDVEYGELTTCALNKSESNDSGLHSENTSNLCTVSFSDSQQTLSLTDSAAPSPLESPTDAMGSGDPAGCLEQSSAPGKIEQGSPAKCSVLQESGSRNAACDCRSDSGGSGSDSGFCSNDYCMFHVDDAEADGARPQGLGKRPDVLELPNSPMGDADECVFDSDEPGNGRPSPSHPCLRSPSPTRDSSSPSVQSALHSLDHPCASPQNLLSKGSETGEVNVEAPEEVCVSTDTVVDTDTSNNTCAKPKSVEVAPPTSDDHNESDGNDESDDEEATSSSDETNEEDEGNGKEDAGGDDMKEENGGSNAEQMEVPSTAVAELSLDGLSVGDLTTMENLIAGTVDLNGNRNGNRSSLPAPPPSIQAQVGGAAPLGEGECLRLPRVQRLRYADSCTSFCSSSGSVHSSPVRDNQWEKESACSIASSETSSYNSECHDEEEIAMAIQAAEVASRNEARMRFRSSSDMIHRLFVVISGVADQLQTNFASDLRHILRAVFDMNCSEPLVSSDGKESGILSPEIPHRRRPRPQNRPRPQQLGRAAPEWMPDELCSTCLACSMPFTLIRRRHHCRNCGRIYCGRCSSNVVPLPHYGHHKPVRVCNRCFMFQVTAFTMTSHS